MGLNGDLAQENRLGRMQVIKRVIRRLPHFRKENGELRKSLSETEESPSDGSSSCLSTMSSSDTNESSIRPDFGEMSSESPKFLENLWENLHGNGAEGITSALEVDVRQKLKQGESAVDLQRQLERLIV